VVFVFEFLIPILWGIVIFSILIHFDNFSAPDATIREVRVLFGHQKQLSPPLGSGLSEHLSDHSWAVLRYHISVPNSNIH